MCNLFKRLFGRKNRKTDVKILPQYYYTSSFDTELFHLICQYRGDAEFMSDLASVAYTHCEAMETAGKPSHDNFTSRAELIKSVYPNTRVFEIVAYGYMSAGGVMHAWKKSVGHDNILRKDWDGIGIASKDGYVCALMIKYE